MSRNLRIESPTGYYHIMQRGVGKQILFEDSNDYLRYIEKLRDCKEELGFELAAYCLMNNHVHLLIRSSNVAVMSKLMLKIGTSYAAYYNIKYDHVGTVFQSRYLSEPITDEKYLRDCTSYIHNNPVKAGISAIDRYVWSSYSDYLGNHGLADTKSVLDSFGSLDAFKEYHNRNCEHEYLECETDLATCDKGLEIIRKHYGTEFENTLIVKQLCKSERNQIIHEMKKAGLSLKRIELLTGVSKDIVRRVK